jgi:2-alkyl-3-oxoalkanoate reductase
VRILVTGSNGFVGRAVVADADARGWEVVGLGRQAVPAAPVHRYVRHDLAGPLRTDDIGPVDAVVHAAALASPWAPPRAFVAANVDGTRTIVRWAAANGAPPLVHVSSTSVLYRDADQTGLTEDSPVLPDDQQINVYSRTKAVAERIVARYPGRTVVVRPRAVFGPGDTVLLPRIIAAAERGALPVLEPAGGPPVVVDLTVVGTVARYVNEAVAREVFGVFNLTNGEPVELYPFLTDVLTRLRVDVRPRRVPVWVAQRAADAAELVSATMLGWSEPALTRFGVHVLSRSTTFDVTKTLSTLGEPAVSIADGVEALVAARTAR